MSLVHDLNRLISDPTFEPLNFCNKCGDQPSDHLSRECTKPLEEIKIDSPVLVSLRTVSHVANTNIYITNLKQTQTIMMQSDNEQESIDIIVNVCMINHPEPMIDQWCKVKGRQYVWLPLEDRPGEDVLSKCAEPIYDLIERHIDQHVLIHCEAGISRSVSCVIYYLIRKHRMTYLQALGLIRQVRPLAIPNGGFRKQLLKVESEFIGQKTVGKHDEHRTVESF